MRTSKYEFNNEEPKSKAGKSLLFKNVKAIALKKQFKKENCHGNSCTGTQQHSTLTKQNDLLHIALQHGDNKDVGENVQ